MHDTDGLAEMLEARRRRAEARAAMWQEPAPRDDEAQRGYRLERVQGAGLRVLDPHFTWDDLTPAAAAAIILRVCRPVIHRTAIYKLGMVGTVAEREW